MSNTITVEQADRVIRADYYEDVQSTAQGLKDEIDEGQITDADQFMERLDEAIDGDRRVIMTWQAMQGVIYSSQDADLAIQEFGADGLNWSNGIPWSQLMYPIFRQDVIDALESMGVDVNDPIKSDNLERDE